MEGCGLSAYFGGGGWDGVGWIGASENTAYANERQFEAPRNLRHSAVACQSEGPPSVTPFAPPDRPLFFGATEVFSTPRTALAPTHPEINERLWCAARAISQPLVRVFSISARKEGQSTVISPMEMTSSR